MNRSSFCSFIFVIMFCITVNNELRGQDIITYVGRDVTVARSGRLTDILDLGNGKYAILGSDKTLDWIPLGTPKHEITYPLDKIDNDLGTEKYCFIIIIDTALINKSIEKVFYLEKNKVENFRFIKHTAVTGSPIGSVYISGDRASSTNAGYFIGKLDNNFVTGEPTKFDWVVNIKAGGMMFTHQPWDVGGDGKVVFGEGTSYSTGWAAVRRLKADGTPDVVTHWRVHFKANGTEVVDTIAPFDAVNSCTTIKIDGRGCIQSMNLADYNLITPDGNGGWKKGKYPFDIFFKGEINGTWDISGQGGYTRYRKGSNPTGGIGSIAIDKRNNDMFIGFNFQSTLPSGLPDFEPAVMKMDKNGRLVWWSRMYTESTDPACEDKSKLFNSTPDQYVDGMAIDYATNNLVVNARCHGNNVKNFWTSNNAFQKSFTGTNGNIHISWLGKLKLADGAFTAGTYVAGYSSKAPTGPKYTEPHLAGWANHNNGVPNDLNTTRLHPNALKVDKNGGVSVIGMGQRVVTTKNAYMEQDSIVDNAAPWSDFVRVYSSDFRYVSYSSIVHSSFVTGGQKYNGSDVILQGLIPLSKGALVVGYNKADPANVFNVDCRNVPLGWGQDGINGPTPFLAKLTGEIAPRYNNQTLPANPQLSTGGAQNNFNGLDQVYLPDGSTVSAFQTESPNANLLWNVDLHNGDSILGLHRNSAIVKWNASGRKEWHIDFDYGYDAPLGHDHHYPVIDKPFAPGGETRFRKIVADSEGGIYLAGSVWGGPDSIAGQPKFLYPKSFMNDAHGGRCDSIPWPCFQRSGDPNHFKRVALSFVLKYNSQGRFQWAKTYWGNIQNDQGGIDIAIANGGNVAGNDTLLVIVSVSQTINGLIGGILVGGLGKASYNTDGTQLRAINNGHPVNPDNAAYNVNDRFSIVKHGTRFFVIRRNMSANLKVDGVSVSGGGSNSADVFVYELNQKTMLFQPRYTKITLSNADLNVSWSDYAKKPANIFLLPRASADDKAAFYLVGTCLSGKAIGQKAEMTITGSNVSEAKRVIVEKQKADTLSSIPFIVLLKENVTTALTRNLVYDNFTVKIEDQIFDFNKKLGKEKIDWRLDGLEALLSANSNSSGELYMMLRMKNNVGYSGIVKINNEGSYFPPGINNESDISKGSHIMYFKVMPNGTATYLTKPHKLTYGISRPHKVGFDLTDNPTFVSVIGDNNAELKLGSITINGNKSGYVFAKMDKTNPNNWLYANTFRYWNNINYPAPGISNPLKFCDQATVADLYNAVMPESKPVDVHFYEKLNDPGSANLVNMSHPLKNDSVYFTEQWYKGDSIMSKRIAVTVKIFKTPILNKSSIANCPTCQSLNVEGKIKLFGATADEGVVYWSKDVNFSSYEVGDTVQIMQDPSTEAVRTYYYKAVNGGKCHSETESITIRLMPSLKVTNDTICGAGQVTLRAKPVFWVRSGSGTTATVSEVNASGTVRWYDAPIGGNLLLTQAITTGGTSEYKPIISDGEIRPFWVEVSTGTCGAHERFKVEAYSFGVPVITKTSPDRIICGPGSLTLKAATSKPLSQVHWYADAACTNLLSVGDELEIASQNPPLSRTYYAKASYNGRCEGNLIQYNVDWKMAAGIKLVEHDTICGSGNVTLKATALDPSQTIRWYDTATGGTLIFTGSTYTAALTTSRSFFVEADNGVCGISPRLEVSAMVKNLATLTGVTYNAMPTTAIVVPVGTSMHILPIVSGDVDNFAIVGVLPVGLIFNSATGEVSGFPSVVQSTVNYTLKAINSCGEVSTNFTITVNNIPPSGLSYSPSTLVATRNITDINSLPTIGGGAVVSYSISPALPTGVSINTRTGVISGTPTALLPQTEYTITATNTGGSTSGTFTLKVNDAAPSGLTYSPALVVATKGVTMINAVPANSGGAVVSYSVSPALPAGVSLNTTTGVISGTPTALLPQTEYTITATNTGGSTSSTFTLKVNDAAPSGLTYSPALVVATKGVTMINAVPANSGGAVVSYSVNPALPAGVGLNTSTGVISGTPTALLAQTEFTITATNTGGSTTGTFTLTVSDAAPSGLTYSPATLIATKGITAINASPTISGGAVVSYSISPALPAGVGLNTSTGVISGTPTALLAQTEFTITATNTGGSTTGTFTLTVNDFAPSGLTYSPVSVIATKGVTAINAAPTISGGAVVSYSISPALPAGVIINTTTGVISGTPTALLTQTEYIITVTNTGGSTSGTFTLTVNDAAPSGLTYSPATLVATKGITAINASPTISGGAVVSYSVNPALPAGLSLNTTTGVISGTPTALLTQTEYTITATNTGGSTSGTFTLKVNDAAPSGLTYSPALVVATKGVTMINAVPAISGGAVVSYSVNPALPAGVSLNTSTGVISGTPTALLVQTEFTVTATNTGGSTTGTFTLTVNDAAPSGLTYSPATLVATKSITAINASPTISGGAVVSYSVNPALPAGVSLNTTTGVISGTPTALLVQTEFTITATNTGGSTTGTFTLTVNDAAPSGLTYSPATLVATKGITAINASPTISGGAVVSYSVNPALPAGVGLNTSTGVISGTPTALLVQTEFTITATNTGGSTTGTFTLTANDAAPSGLTYSPATLVATKGITAINASPTISGGAVVSYSISPALPAGVSLNTSTGVISGTPTALLVQTEFAITATNTGGSTTGTFTLTVNDVAPSGLTYSPISVIATKGVTAINAAPTISGGAVVSYSISPALPAGVGLNTSTGVISGTPTALLVQTEFAITATNTGGSTTSIFTLTVNDPAPGAIIYNPASVIATKGVTAINASPIDATGLSEFSISPALPAGVSINTTTGVISGTPTALLVQTEFTITATNTGGSTTGTFTLTVNDVAPSGLTYSPISVIATKGVTAINAAPTISGGAVVSYSVSPALPAGVSLNTSTGVISGTPKALLAQTEFIITAINTGGSTTGTFTLTVNDFAPSGLTYSPVSVIATKGVTAINAFPTISGGAVVSYSISPALPAGVGLNTSTGVISGTPTALLAQTEFVITAINTGGSTTSIFTLTVNDPAPGAIIYNPASVIATKGVTAINASPIDATGLSGFSISPALPAGVSINTTTGVISGTPTALLVQTEFTITATNTGGSTTGTFTLTVNDVAPSGLTYSPVSVIATKGVTAINAFPTISAGAVVSYSISPALPAGVGLNTSTGVISGTPTALLAQTTFTITATNTGGSTTGTFTLAVLDDSKYVQTPQILCFPARIKDMKTMLPIGGTLKWWTAEIDGLELRDSSTIEAGRIYFYDIYINDVLLSTRKIPVEVFAAPLISNTIICPNEITFDMFNNWLGVSTEELPNAKYYWLIKDEVISENQHINLSIQQYVDSGFIDIGLRIESEYACMFETHKKVWILPANIPNTITPNDDGINDVFMKGFEIEIYNRNGVKLFEGVDGWDGRYKGRYVENGTYFFLLKYNRLEERKQITGYITVSKP